MEPSSSHKTLDNPGNKFALVASFVVPAVFVVAFLFMFITLQRGAQAAVVSIAGLLPVGYAFAAGMVSSVNPCGFFMLPVYISYHLGTEETGFYELHPTYRVLKALMLGLVATLGFVVLFASIGAIISAGGRWLVTFFPYAGIVIAVVMIGLGLWLLITRRTLGFMAAASRVSVTPERNLWNVFLFGIGYAISSLCCTLPIFLVVVVTSLASRGLLDSFGQFIGYAMGMGAILVAVTIGAALFRGTVASWLRGAIPYVHRVSALLLVGAGAYLIYYWVFYSRFFF
ncbi:MAG: cytochrome c biogenesis protein CcdA [Chloroflexi bacterium]|nr:cytochrome c biogenesis protein CcdA [Chloroflexota bacterium]